MSTQFTVTDHAAAASAASKLPAALTMAATTIAVTSQQLRPHPDDPVPPDVALAALVKWQRGQARRDSRISAVMLLLHEAGASERGLADALGMSRGTVAARLVQARVDRAAEAEEAGRWTPTHTHGDLYKGRAAHLGATDAADSGGSAHRTVNWAFAPFRASSGTDPGPAKRYKRRCIEGYSQLYAPAVGPMLHIGRTSTGPAGRMGQCGRTSRIRSSRAISGGFR